MTAVEAMTNQMIELRLTGMRECIAARFKQAREADLGYEEFFSLLLQDEVQFRRGARIKRLIKRASFRHAASLEEFDQAEGRGLDKKHLRDLATNRYVEDGINLLILGPTGVGKTYLATALGNAACRSGYTTLFFRMNSLIEQLTLARAKGTYLNLLKRLSSCDLLILDDFGIKPLDAQHYQDFYDVIDERGEDKSTVMTSQLPVENWSEVIADQISCEAVSDRIASTAIRLVMQGASYRPKRKRNSEKNLDKN